MLCNDNDCLDYRFFQSEMGEEVKAIVPESVLKKQKREEEWALAKKQELEAAKKKRVQSRKLIYNRAKQYAKEYDDQVHISLCFFVAYHNLGFISLRLKNKVILI